MLDFIDKPWGYEIILGMWNGWRIKILHVDEGHSTSVQYHEKKFEVMFFSDGHYEVINPNKIHSLDGKDGALDVLEIAKGDDSDIVRLKDKYGRENK